ncbi:50S ribosome-binding GTPase [Nostoc sp. UHCC 0702]|nr:50S ribosome-binding GTPase [Nostoc sp. UHCC 0702]
MQPNNEQEIKKLLNKIFENSKNRKLTFLLVGLSGVGKSSTINSLMGVDIAKVGDFVPTTDNVDKYDTDINGIPCTFIDTPGFADGKNKEYEYIEIIRKLIPSIDCMLYVTPLINSRILDDEQKAISTISNAFCNECWEKSVIVFTKADLCQNNRIYWYYVENRRKLFRKEIAKHTSPEIANKIPSVAVVNSQIDGKPLPTPDGNPWLGVLYYLVIKRISKAGLTNFFIATAPRLDTGETGLKSFPHELSFRSEKEFVKNNNQLINPIKLNPEQNLTIERTIKERGSVDLVGLATLAGTLSAAGGAIAGPAGVVAGTVLGLIGGLVIQFWSSRS